MSLGATLRRGKIQTRPDGRFILRPFDPSIDDVLGTVGCEDSVHDLFGPGDLQERRNQLLRPVTEVTRDLRGLRGKLEMGAMATRALRARGLTSCTYEELSHDVLHNRILRSTLRALLGVPAPRGSGTFGRTTPACVVSKPDT